MAGLMNRQRGAGFLCRCFLGSVYADVDNLFVSKSLHDNLDFAGRMVGVGSVKSFSPIGVRWRLPCQPR